MKTRFLPVAVLATAASSPALAASGPFFSMNNTNFVVTISFILFVGAIIYFKAPKLVAKLLDGKIDAIRSQIEEAKSLRAEAQQNLEKAKAERSETEDQAERIVTGADASAKNMVAEAEEAIEAAVKHRLRTAEDQIAIAEADAIAAIRNEAIDIAVAAASEVISASLTSQDQKEMISKSIKEIDTKLH